MEILAVSHVHSKWSYDGSWTLEALATEFAGRGHRVLMMTEHDRGFTESRLAEYRAACAAATTGRILVVPGIEYSDAANRVHVLTWGPVPFLGENLTTEQVLEGVARHGGLAVLAHPGRKAAFECVRPDWIERLLGIEIWNRKYDGWAPGDQASALVRRSERLPFVGLDFHNSRQMFSLAMALELDGPADSTIDEAAVLDCLRRGRCAPRAFGRPLDERFEGRLPLLRVAERGRRKLAAIKRYSKARLSR